MRSFSESEKKIIKEIVACNKIDNSSIYDLLYKHLGVIAVEWNEDYTVIVIYHTSKEDKYTALCEFIFLLDILKNEGYIFFYGFTNRTENVLFDKRKHQKEHGHYFEISESEPGLLTRISQRQIHYYTDLGKKLNEYINSFVYVSESLKVLERNNFLSKEERQFKKMYNLGFGSLIVGIVSVIASLFISQCSQKQTSGSTSISIEKVCDEISPI